jgi:hypothetical protein
MLLAPEQISPSSTNPSGVFFDARKNGPHSMRRFEPLALHELPAAERTELRDALHPLHANRWRGRTDLERRDDGRRLRIGEGQHFRVDEVNALSVERKHTSSCR